MSLQDGLNEIVCDSEYRVPQPFGRGFQIQQLCNRGFFQNPKRADDRQTSLPRGFTSVTLVDEKQVGEELTRKT